MDDVQHADWRVGYPRRACARECSSRDREAEPVDMVFGVGGDDCHQSNGVVSGRWNGIVVSPAATWRDVARRAGVELHPLLQSVLELGRLSVTTVVDGVGADGGNVRGRDLASGPA